MNILLLGHQKDYDLVKAMHNEIKDIASDATIYLPKDIFLENKDPKANYGEEQRKYVENLLKMKGEGQIDMVILCNKAHDHIDNIRTYQLGMAIEANKKVFLLNEPDPFSSGLINSSKYHKKLFVIKKADPVLEDKYPKIKKI